MEGILDHIIEQLITTIFREPDVSPTTTSRGAATYAPRAIWATINAVWTKWTMPQTFLVVFFKHDDFSPKSYQNMNRPQVIFRGSLGVPFDIPPGYHRHLKITSPSSISSLTKRSNHQNKCVKRLESSRSPQNKVVC